MGEKTVGMRVISAEFARVVSYKLVEFLCVLSAIVKYKVYDNRTLQSRTLVPTSALYTSTVAPTPPCASRYNDIAIAVSFGCKSRQKLPDQNFTET